MSSHVYKNSNLSFSNDLPSLDVRNSNWRRWLTFGISLALMLAIVVRFQAFGYREALSALPKNPVFWLSFGAYYLALPGSEWVIFRRLWRIPRGGFAALLRKLVSNEVLFGYSGEAYFYAWARRHAKLIAAPFGAIKDVSILSALAGNITTLVMLALAWPLLDSVVPQLHGQAIALSTAFILGTSMLILAIRGKLFSLPRNDLHFILRVHLVRLVATTLLSGLMWHTALPTVPFTWLILLATLQLLVTRLPFVPSKDLVFANLAMLLIGHDNTVTMVIAMIAAALLATHLVVGAVVVLPDLLRKNTP